MCLLLDIRVALFMSRWLLNIRKVFFPLLRSILLLDGDGFNGVIDWLLIEGERKTCFAVGPVRLLSRPKKNEITETRRESMSQDRKVFDSSSLFRAHSKMSARRADESRSGERPINQLADRRDLCRRLLFFSSHRRLRHKCTDHVEGAP